MSKASFEEILNRDGRLIYSSVGDSMLPMIKQGRDLLVIEKPAGRLERYDIPLLFWPPVSATGVSAFVLSAGEI